MDGGEGLECQTFNALGWGLFLAVAEGGLKGYGDAAFPGPGSEETKDGEHQN